MSCDVSRLRYRGGSVLVPALPICHASRFPHLVISCCLLGLPMSSPLCCLIACVPSSSRAVVPSSHPSSLAILLACRHASRFTARLSPRLSSRPSSRFSPRLASRPARSPPRAVRLCGYRSPRSACRLGWERDGTGSSLSPSPVRLTAAACPGMAYCLRAFPRCGLLCLLWCRRLCLYCDGEIIYMICPVAII